MPSREKTYKGYSPPKCTCNAINLHTFSHIHIKHACLYMNVYMPCPISQVLTDFLTHAYGMYENNFKTKDFFFFLKLIGHSPIYNKVDNPPNSDIMISIRQPSDMILYCTGHSSIVQYTGQSSEIKYDGQPSEFNSFEIHVMHSHSIYAMSLYTCNANATA